MTTNQTAHCNCCHRNVAVKTDGTFFKHRQLGRRWEGPVNCDGSGKRPEEVEMRNFLFCYGTPRCEMVKT